MFHLARKGASRGWLAVAAMTLVANAAADSVLHSHSNEHPEIQMYSYPSGSSNGAGSVRDRAPTFGSFAGSDPDTGETFYYQGSGLDPTRRGSFIVATDTSGDVPAGLDPSRYQIESLRVTATLLGNLIYEPLGYVLPYDNTLDDSIALTTGGGDTDAGRPIEMYGIGLSGDYETIGFEPEPDGDQLQLGDVRWRRYREGEEGYNPELPASEQAFAPYQFYAVDAQGRDAENAVVGGYSATEASGETPQFTPDPLAIGKLYDGDGVEYTPGVYMDTGDLFVFEPDLSNSGILSYVQDALSEGWLGFSFSSLHQPDGHTGAEPYPDFYLDDWDVGHNQNGAAPTIEVVVTVLDPLLDGDFDGDGSVDASDYDLWRAQYGGPGPEADGNDDGVVDAADYSLWRDNAGAGVRGDAIAVPEPGAGRMALAFLAAAAFCGWQRWFLSPKRGA